ncbi:hypothetical protein Emag_004358 [Eimeria magna]
MRREPTTYSSSSSSSSSSNSGSNSSSSSIGSKTSSRLLHALVSWTSQRGLILPRQQQQQQGIQQQRQKQQHRRQQQQQQQRRGLVRLLEFVFKDSPKGIAFSLWGHEVQLLWLQGLITRSAAPYTPHRACCCCLDTSALLGIVSFGIVFFGIVSSGIVIPEIVFPQVVSCGIVLLVIVSAGIVFAGIVSFGLASSRLLVDEEANLLTLDDGTQTLEVAFDFGHRMHQQQQRQQQQQQQQEEEGGCKCLAACVCGSKSFCCSKHAALSEAAETGKLCAVFVRPHAVVLQHEALAEFRLEKLSLAPSTDPNGEAEWLFHPLHCYSSSSSSSWLSAVSLQWQQQEFAPSL